jgi:CheY-like chemotaxis protein
MFRDDTPPPARALSTEETDLRRLLGDAERARRSGDVALHRRIIEHYLALGRGTPTAADDDADARAEVRPVGRAPHVLIAADSLDHERWLRAVLEQHRLHAVVATCAPGDTGSRLERFPASAPTLLVVAVPLRFRGGLAAARQARELRRRRRVPVVLLSQQLDEHEQRLSAEAGIDASMEMPDDLAGCSVLVGILRRLLRLAAAPGAASGG